MVKAREFPEEGELVVGTVREVQNFGAFIKLEEYPGKEGFVHIAEVSSGWVKRIRDYVREQARVVCKVLNVDTGKGHIDLSLKRVNEHQKRETIQEWKNEQKAEKLFEIVAERIGKTTDEAYKEFGYELIDVYGTLYGAFEEAAYDLDAIKEEGVDGAWLGVFGEVAVENIQIPFVDIAGYIDATIPGKDGVDDLKKALAAAEGSEFEDVEIHVTYLGAPHYRVKVRAPDYKVAEEELRKAADRTIQLVHKSGGTGSYHRELKEEK
ncbi:MAG: translation initiation factor IF-2 subunit alpha [Euryarchaeota archaeon]|nr:translation initiation factor IF-2 subunit alpha [Euryarchaeota archaeon]